MYSCNARHGFIGHGSTLCAPFLLFFFLKFVFRLCRISFFTHWQFDYLLETGAFQNKPGSATQTHGVLFYLPKSERDKMAARLKRSRKCAVEY